MCLKSNDGTEGNYCFESSSSYNCCSGVGEDSNSILYDYTCNIVMSRASGCPVSGLIRNILLCGSCISSSLHRSHLPKKHNKITTWNYEYGWESF